MSAEHMGVRDAVVACVRGAFQPLRSSLSSASHTHSYDSIVRAFLIEEAKVVKRVIKSQQNAGPTSLKDTPSCDTSKVDNLSQVFPLEGSDLRGD
jgi:hypothetical protein